MSDVEGDSILKVEIEDRIHALAVNVQERNRHSRFVPGFHWWLAHDSVKAEEGQLTFWEQLGVSKVSFDKHFSRKWKNKIERGVPPFNLYNIRVYNKIPYITEKKEFWFSSYGTETAAPNDKDAIIHRKNDEKTVSRLRRDIENKGAACRAGRAAARLVEESSPYRCTVAPVISPYGAASTTALSSEPTPDEASLLHVTPYDDASTTTLSSEQTHYEASLLAMSSIVPTDLSSQLESPQASNNTSAQQDRVARLHGIAAFVKTFRIKATTLDVKCLRHIGHEVMTVLAKESASNATVRLYPQSGGQGKEYARLTHHRAATSSRSVMKCKSKWKRKSERDRQRRSDSDAEVALEYIGVDDELSEK
jgi:hypothetical protein